MEEGRRSIQDLIPPARSKPVRPATRPEAPLSGAPPPGSALPPNPRAPQGGGLWRLLAFVIAAVIIFGIAFFIVSALLHRASATVTLRSFAVPVSASFEASPTGENLAFTEKTVEDTLSKTVASTGSVRAEDKASGTITILNAYSSSPQRLIANTRFELKDGRIYRIKAPVTVPGYTKEGSTLKPGSVPVTVYADQAGEGYDLAGPADFTLPGLAGSSQFATITGHLSGAIEGGFIGDTPVVSDAVRSQAVEDLSAVLGQRIRAALVESLGDLDLVFPDSITLLFTTEPAMTVSGGAEITVRGVASAPVFSKEAVARVIANEGGISLGGPLVVTNLDALAPVLAPSKNAGNLTLSLSGTASLTGSYDREAFVRSLVGKSRRDVGASLSAYPAIEDMTISVYPFWKGVLPSDPARISITEILHAAP